MTENILENDKKPCVSAPREYAMNETFTKSQNSNISSNKVKLTKDIVLKLSEFVQISNFHEFLAVFILWLGTL